MKDFFLLVVYHLNIKLGDGPIVKTLLIREALKVLHESQHSLHQIVQHVSGSLINSKWQKSLDFNLAFRFYIIYFKI